MREKRDRCRALGFSHGSTLSKHQMTRETRGGHLVDRFITSSPYRSTLRVRLGADLKAFQLKRQLLNSGSKKGGIVELSRSCAVLPCASSAVLEKCLTVSGPPPPRG